MTGYAPVNGLKMYYEIHGSGEPVVLLHGAFMAISGDWSGLDQRTCQNAESDRHRDAGPRAYGRHQTRYYLRKPRRRCGRRCSIISRSRSADIVGYSLGGGVAMQCAIRHPEKVRKVVSISAPFRRDGWVKEANDFWPNFTVEMFKGTPAETE